MIRLRNQTCSIAGVFRVALLLLAALPIAAKDWYLFTSFRGNGETGLYLALSEDGAHWTALNDDKPWLNRTSTGCSCATHGWAAVPMACGTFCGLVVGRERTPEVSS
ncbi:MAG: hypothetical protein ACJ746_31570 [Bryobacteraceae bacterium]